jgi:NAD(P)H-dependent FMN reductase
MHHPRIGIVAGSTYGRDEYQRKPAAFVSYGGVGGARSVEHLRQIVNTLQMAPVPTAMHIGMAEFMGLLQQGKEFGDYPHLGHGVAALLDDLQWWTRALVAARGGEGGIPGGRPDRDVLLDGMVTE